MRITKTSTHAHVQNLKKNFRAIPLPLEETFNNLVGLLEPVQASLETRVNNPLHYELWTTHIYRTFSQKARYKKGLMFASVIVFSKFVSFYFYPLYLNKELKNQLSDELKPFVGGESCFHFKKPDDIPHSGLNRLIADGFAYYSGQGWIKEKS